jgi:hypothetical protein
MTFTEKQTNAINLGKNAATQSEKDAALDAIKTAFPGLSSYKTKWSDGTVSE